MANEEEPEQETRLRENLIRFNEIRLGGDLRTLADWQHEVLRQDRERGKLVEKLARIQEVLKEHQHCGITCDVIIDAQAVLDE